MALPISFVIGAAIGAVSTYYYKDHEARERAIETSKVLKAKASDMITATREKIAAKKAEKAAEQPAVAAAA
jgi:hypothetical protein